VLTVREPIGLRIKDLARTQGLTVSEYLERAITFKQPLKANAKEEWATCNLCNTKLKARNISEHLSKVHPKPR